MIKIGLIGCGAVVHNSYGPTLVGRSGYRVTHAFDLNETQAASAAALFGAEVTSLERLLDEADAVIVTTPPRPHAELVRAALREDRIILCEKPFMVSAEEAANIVRDAADASARLYVSQFRRVFPHVELARDLVELGAIGDIESFAAFEGGRFTWHAISRYTSQDPKGGVVWDTGAHTVDMALFVSGLDRTDLAVDSVEVRKDKAEPSHEFSGRFGLTAGGRAVTGTLALSRKRVLPNLVRIRGDRGEIAFIAGMDTRVRVTTSTASKTFTAERSHKNNLECFDLQLRRVFGDEGADIFEADRFVGQIRILEALTDA